MGYKVMKAARVYEPAKIMIEEVEEEVAPFRFPDSTNNR
jgi:hypothetical protein